MDETPFHLGEQAAQARAGQFSRGTGIRSFMPEQHRLFFPLLPYLFVAGLDREGWPIGTVLHGAAGFVQSPTPNSLQIAARPRQDAAASPALETGRSVGLLGLDFTTRRRNRANGVVAACDASGLTVAVSQSFGNCAKYIQMRTPMPQPFRPGSVDVLAGLDAVAREVVGKADTLFIASAAGEPDPRGGVDISHRGGRPGFVRIEGDLLTIPDFAGNSYFNTFGNLLLEPRAALLIPDFATGDVLQLQGLAEIIWDGPQLQELAGAQRLLRLRIVRGWRRRAALPFRWTAAEPAPTTLETGNWMQERPAA